MKWPGVMDEQDIFPVVFEKPTDMLTCLFNLEYTWSRLEGIYTFFENQSSPGDEPEKFDVQALNCKDTL